MKHPSQEQWMDFLYGELPKTQRADLAAHLKSCPSCAAQVGRWGAVQEQLDDWQLPEVKRSWRVPAPVRWAMVAAFMLAALGIGFGAGRAASTKALRQEMQVALQEAQRETQVALQNAQKDNLTLLMAIKRLDDTRQAEILALRKDLETVAINADNSFKETERTLIPLIQLAASQQTTAQP